MGLLKAANSTALEWVDVEKAPFASGYEPVMALAQNHIFFIDVPGVPAGSVDIYVIHCESRPCCIATPLTCFTSVNYFQPEAQAFPASNGVIPATHGQTASFFQTQGVRGICVLYPFYSFQSHRVRIRYKKHLHTSFPVIVAPVER